MNTIQSFRLGFVAAALAFTGVVSAQTMSAAEYGAARERVEADYKVARAACDKLDGNAEDICTAEAKGQEKVAKAELAHRRSGKADDARKLVEARADAAYDVAKERCDDMKGNDKDVCMKDAKAAQTRAKADARAGEKSAEARKDAAEDKRDANYAAAAERCDSLSGQAKDDCQKTARALRQVMDKNAPPTSHGVFKPVDHVVISFPSQDDASQAAAALRQHGLGGDAITTYTDREMREQAIADLGRASTIATIGQEVNLVKAHLALADMGYHFLVVEAADLPLAQRVAELVRPFRAERAQLYGRFVIEDLIQHPGDEAQVAESPDRGLDAQTPSGLEEERALRRGGG